MLFAPIGCTHPPPTFHPYCPCRTYLPRTLPSVTPWSWKLHDTYMHCLVKGFQYRLEVYTCATDVPCWIQYTACLNVHTGGAVVCSILYMLLFVWMRVSGFACQYVCIHAETSKKLSWQGRRQVGAWGCWSTPKFWSNNIILLYILHV